MVFSELFSSRHLGHLGFEFFRFAQKLGSDIAARFGAVVARNLGTVESSDVNQSYQTVYEEAVDQACMMDSYRSRRSVMRTKKAREEASQWNSADGTFD